MPQLQKVIHPLPAVFNEESRVLLLGSMPSPKSRELGFYYSHPQNRFWPVLAALFGQPVPPADCRKSFVLAHRIALWDVLCSCEISGASDSSIRHPVANDLRPLLQQGNIRAIFTTGTQAQRLYIQLCLPSTGRMAEALPSTSPANARYSLAQLVKAYQVILPYLQED